MEFLHFSSSSPDHLLTADNYTKDGVYALITDHALPEEQPGLSLASALAIKSSVHPQLLQLELKLNAGADSSGATAQPILFIREYHGTALWVGPLEDVQQENLVAIYGAVVGVGLEDHFSIRGWNHPVPPRVIAFFRDTESYGWERVSETDGTTRNRLVDEDELKQLHGDKDQV